MSFEESYDSDGDVHRFLQSPGRDSHLLDVPEPEPTHFATGQIDHALQVVESPNPPSSLQMPNQEPATVGFVQGPTAVDAGQQQAPATLGFQGPTMDAGAGQHQAPAMGAFLGMPVVDAEQHQALATLSFQGPTIDAGQHQAPAALGFQAPALGVEHHHPFLPFGFQAPGTDAPVKPAFDFNAQIADGGHNPVPAFGAFQALLLGIGGYAEPEPGFGFGMEQQQPAPLGFHQQQIANDGEQQQNQAHGVFGYQPPDVEGHPSAFGNPFGFQQSLAAMDVDHHMQAPPVFGFQHSRAMDMGNHQAPAFGFQAPANDVDNLQAQPFVFQAPAMDVVEQQHHAPAIQGVENNLAPAMDVVEQKHHAPSIQGVEHNLAPAMDAVEQQHHAPSIQGVEHNLALAMDVVEQHHHAPAMQGVEHNLAPAMDIGHHQSSVMDYIEHILQAPVMDNVENNQVPVMEDVEEEHHAPVMGDVEEDQQSPVMEDVEEDQQSPVIEDDEEEDHQEPPATDVQPAGTTTVLEEAHHDAPDPPLEQHGAAGVDNDSWVNAMLAQNVPRLVIPSPSPPRQDNGSGSAANGDEEVQLPPVEEAIVYRTLVPGTLDCTRCHNVREILHEAGRRKLFFIVHSTEQGVAQHAIVHRLSGDDNGQFQTDERVYVSFGNYTHGSVQGFIESSIEGLRNLGTGRIQEETSTMTLAPPDNASHAELEINMLGHILMQTPLSNNGEGADPGSSPQVVRNAVQNSNGSSQSSSLPVTQAEGNNHAVESNFNPPSWHGFTPEYILESSHVQPYDPKSNTNVLLYPSLIEKMRQREQARTVNVTIEDTLKMFDEAKEEIAGELDFSSLMFKQLKRKDKLYGRHANRINELNKKITKLIDDGALKHSSSGLFSVRQKMEMYRQEKADLFGIIEIGLEEIEKDNEDAAAAGPSGT